MKEIKKRKMEEKMKKQIMLVVMVIFMISILSARPWTEVRKDYECGLDNVEILVMKDGNSLSFTTSNLEKKNEIVGTISFQFDLKFNNEVQYLSNELGEIAKDGIIVVNDENRGVLKIAYMKMYPLTGEGKFLTLNFSDEISDYSVSNFYFNTKEISKITYSENESPDDSFPTELRGNHPNPFKNLTEISFSLNPNQAKNARIEIYNIKGQKVKTLNIDSANSPIKWNATDEDGKSVSSGIYFYKLKAGNYTCTKKMILMK